jgi:hypothetical protein
VIETNVYECGWWTEKTAKCLVAGKPFILLGTSGQLTELKRLGFKTFDPWIDESYDNEPNAEKRFDMIKSELHRIASLSNIDQQKMLLEINTVADHNRISYKRLINEYVDKS